MIWFSFICQCLKNSIKWIYTVSHLSGEYITPILWHLAVHCLAYNSGALRPTWVKHVLTPKPYFLNIKANKARYLKMWALSYQVVCLLDTSKQYTIITSYYPEGATCRTHRTCLNLKNVIVFDKVPRVVFCSYLLWGPLGTDTLLSKVFSKNCILWMADKVPYAWRKKRYI